MGAFFIFAVAAAAIVAFEVLAIRYGVDSRDGSNDPRRPQYPVGIN
jgi:hypothetical protein